MSKLQQDLRKIVGVDEIKKRLDTLEDKSVIASTRGIGYQDGASGQTNSVASTGGSSGKQAPTTAKGSASAAAKAAATEAAKDALEGASNSGGGGGGSGEDITPTTPENGTLDIADILDNFADKDLQGGGDGASSFNPGLAAIDGFTDCETGDSGMLRFDSYIPPVNWTSIEEPPSQDLWELGYYWTTTNPASASDASPTGAADAAISAVQAAFPLPYPTGYGDAYRDAAVTPSGSNYTFVWYQGPSSAPNTATITRQTCSSSGTSLCPTTRPYNYAWEADYYQLLEQTDGSYSGSQYDPMVPDSARQPSSSAYMCFDGGTRAAVMAKGAGDTSLLYEIDPTTQAPLAGTQIHIYDGKKQLKGYADISKLSQYTP